MHRGCPYFILLGKHRSFPLVPLVTSYRNPYLENPLHGCGLAGFSFDGTPSLQGLALSGERKEEKHVSVYENFLTLLSSCHSCAFWAHTQTGEAADAR